jgi:DNA-binding NtrC family response regulator
VPPEPIAVLVVEDEVLLRMITVDAFADEGFEVFDAENATAALEILARHEKINALFTDVDMPGGMDGLKLAAVVKERWPQVQVLVTSGHHAVDADNLPPDARFTRKPYTPEAIIQTVKEMLST